MQRPFDALAHVGHEPALFGLPISQCVVARSPFLIDDQVIRSVHRRNQPLGNFLLHGWPAARLGRRFASED